MKFLKLLDENLERYIMCALLVGMTLVLGIQIVFRFVLNSPLTWSEELARFMFIWSTFLSIGFTLISVFPKKVQAIIYMIGDAVMAVFFIYLLPASWEFAYTSVQSGQVSAACGIPMYFIQISLMVGFALAAFRAIQNIWKNIQALRGVGTLPEAGGEEPPEALELHETKGAE